MGGHRLPDHRRGAGRDHVERAFGHPVLEPGDFVAVMGEFHRSAPSSFAWRQPPYEYETERLPIDLLTGDAAIRLGLEQGRGAVALEEAWQGELRRFLEVRRGYLLYKE